MGYCSSCHLAGGTKLVGNPVCNYSGAINAAVDNDEIWVEQGTYALTAMITVNKKVAIYGGFTGCRNVTVAAKLGDQRNHRGWPEHGRMFLTPLQMHTIDGFTITRGYKGGSGDVDKGAGILNGDPSLGAPPADAPDLTVANCIFYRNESFVKSGGAICNFTSAGEPRDNRKHLY